MGANPLRGVSGVNFFNASTRLRNRLSMQAQTFDVKLNRFPNEFAHFVKDDRLYLHHMSSGEDRERS